MGSLALAPNRVLLGKYRIEAVLGRGGMGVVVRARHVTLDEVVAIKLLGDDMALTAETFARFEREAKAAARLKSEHVVRVSDVGRLDDGMPYMVMELLDGRDLSQLVKAEGPLAPSIAANLMIQVCEVLVEAHAHGIVHRDMKPSNVFLITRDTGLPFVKVLDFGIAKAPEADGLALTRTSAVLGTPDYMSPEQLRSSRSVDARSDVWALGVSLYEVMEGRRPFTGETAFELCFKISDEPAEPMQRTPPAIAAIVMRCLAKKPEDRYQSALELAVALAPFAADRQAAHNDVDRMQRASGQSPPTPPPQIEGRFDPTANVGEPSPAIGDYPTVATPAVARRRRLPQVIALGLVVVAAVIAAVELRPVASPTLPDEAAQPKDAATAIDDAAVAQPSPPPTRWRRPSRRWPGSRWRTSRRR